jgi:hypothetical protein
MIHLMKDNGMNLETFEVFVTSLGEAYGDPDHMNTAKWALSKLCQGSQDFVIYYAEFQPLIVDLIWNDTVKHTALYCGLSKELKDILSIQDIPKGWANYVVLMKKCDMQYCTCKAESHCSLGQKKSTSMPSPCNVSPIFMQAAPHPTSSGYSHFGPIPIDLLAARHYLSPKEYEKQIDEGCCIYWGSFNHMAWDCPNKPRTCGYPLYGATAKTATQPKVAINPTSTS